MNRMHPAKTGAAVAITIAIGYSLCALFFVAFSESSVTSRKIGARSACPRTGSAAFPRTRRGSKPFIEQV